MESRESAGRKRSVDACQGPRLGQGGSVSNSGHAPVGRRITGWRKWLLRFAIAIFVPALFLGIAEVALRIAGCGYPTDFFITSDGGRTWTSNPKFAWRFCGKSGATAPDLVSMPGTKALGTVRVFILGESAAMGTPDPSYGFGRVLEVMLRERHPGVRFEVVNAAMMGISSHVVLPIARDCARRQGDVFVVYMGNNDYIGPWSPLVVPPALASSPTVVRGVLAVRSTKVSQAVETAMRGWGFDRREEQTLETFLSHAVGPADARRETVARNFRANLEDICRTVRAGGGRLVLATVASNLRDFAPLASLHRDGLADADRTQFDEFLRTGEIEESAGRRNEAARRYDEALRIDDQYADLHYRLGRCLVAAGQWDDARRHFVQARDLDALPLRADARLNDAVREVARSGAADGIRLVDVERVFGEIPESPHGIPGEALFWEHVHLTFEGNYALARAVLPEVEASLPASVGQASGPVPTAGRCAERLALTGWDQYRMADVIARMTAKPPFTNQSDYAWRQERRRRMVASLASMELPASLERQARFYQAALEKTPDDWRLHDNFAVLRFQAGDSAAAAEHWQAVRKTHPAAPAVPLRIGDALAHQGKFDEAAAAYQEALRLDPDSVEALQGLARVRLAQGHFDEALARLAEALRIEPCAAGCASLGDLLAERTRRLEAIVWFKKGLALDPANVSLHYRLGLALVEEGRFAEAVGHLWTVLAADPHNLRARCGLARALAQMNKREEAVQQYQLALNLNARLTEAIKGLDELLGGRDGVLGTTKATYLGGGARGATP